MPGTPIQPFSTGPRIIEAANETPMVTPITAITLSRCSSRVRSAASAITAADTAPPPCKARPRMTPPIESASAATTLPRAKISRPR